MKRKTYILLWILILNSPSFSQDTTRISQKKFHLSFDISAGFKGILGDTYVEPAPYAYNDPFGSHRYDEFTKKPSYCLGSGALLSYQFSEDWSIATGVSYYLRKTIYETSRAAINANSIQTIHNVLKYNYSYFNLEFPLLLQYSYGKVTFYAGAQFAVLSFRNAEYTYLMRVDASTDDQYTSQKTVRNVEIALKIYPTIKLSYDMEVKNHVIKPYLGIQIPEINAKNTPTLDCYFIQVGVIVPVF